MEFSPAITIFGPYFSALVQARNTNKITNTQREIAHKNREQAKKLDKLRLENQLKLAHLNIESQEALETRRESFQERMAIQGFGQQVTLEQARQKFQERMAILGFGQQVTLEQARQKFQEKLSRLNHQKQLEIQQFVQSVNVAIHQENLAFQKWRVEQEGELQRELAADNRQLQFELAANQLAFQKWRVEQERELQRELAACNRQLQFELAAYQRETAITLEEARKLFQNWPLTLVPAQILESHEGEGPIPLRVFISPPVVDFDGLGGETKGFPKIENRLARELRQLLNQNYPLNSQDKPTELLDGAWDSKRFRGGASIKALFRMLKSEPTLILESVVDGNYLDFRVAYWGLGPKNPSYGPILSRLCYRDILYESAKARARAWKTEIKDKLLAEGMSLQEINEKYGREGNNAINLAVLEDDEKLRRKGIEIQRHYKPNSDDWELLCRVLEIYHCVVSGVMADVHFLIHHDTLPSLPQWLPEVLKEQSILPLPHLMPWVVSTYQDVLKALEVEQPHVIPSLALYLAKGLAHLTDKSWARELLIESISGWHKQRQLLPPAEGRGGQTVQLVVEQDEEYARQLPNKTNIDELTALIKQIPHYLQVEDKEYLTSLQYLLELLGDNNKTDVQMYLRQRSRLALRMYVKQADRLALHIQNESKIIEFGTPTVYQLPLWKQMRDTNKRLARYHVGEPLFRDVTEKVLMVVGAVGVGKTTLINGIANYILGVKWEDDFRFRLTLDEEKTSWRYSQTSWVTAYTIHKMEGSRFPHTLTIIDTPGFGDTKGLEGDKFITNQIRELLSMSSSHGIEHLDGIGLVVPASLARLTLAQRYIFDSILEIFGKDIVEKLFIMATFADGQRPPVMDAVKEANIQYARYFKLNNSALLAKNVEYKKYDEESFNKMFWRMGFKSLRKFLSYL